MALVGLALLFLTVLLSVMLLTAFHDANGRAEARASTYSQVVSANIQWLMEASYQALRRMDNAVGDSLTTPPESAMADLNAAVDSLPVSVQGWVFDAEGRPRLTNAVTTQAVNSSDREYFVATQNGAPFYISSLITSRSSEQQVFVVAKRIERRGQFVGAAIIVIPATYMDTFRSALQLGPQSTVGLLRNDGMLVSRSPVPAEATDLSQYVLFTEYLKTQDDGTYQAASPMDNVQRIVGYRKVPGFPLVVVASVALDEAFKEFWQTVGILAAVTGPGLIGLLLFAYITAKAQAALGSALERNQVLFREIHHRVKNNLQQVSALVQLQPIDAATKSEMVRRINAMVAVHEHMYRSDQYDTLNARDYLPPLIEGVRSSFAKPIRVSVDLAPALVDRDHALPLALICNEVISNAIKHAFTDERDGAVSVVLESQTPQRARLTIRDNGVGYDPDQKSNGMGNRLIRGLVAQLQASHSVRRENGTIFTLEFDVVGFQ
ncbi:sensor histidine kinase [Devosia sp. LjRoot3]|uniref:sensor histidine kinase n=1 Tax=Devosia sp. LjRoot3 TaxID=3342319 RepID=UPI003ECFFE50